MLKVTFDDGKWQVKELWKNNKLPCKFTSPVSRLKDSFTD